VERAASGQAAAAAPSTAAPPSNVMNSRLFIVQPSQVSGHHDLAADQAG
jgi:hypothetical protein